MLKPGLRLFILPLGAVSMIATLSSQNAPQAAQRETTDEPPQRRRSDEALHGSWSVLFPAALSRGCFDDDAGVTLAADRPASITAPETLGFES